MKIWTLAVVMVVGAVTCYGQDKPADVKRDNVVDPDVLRAAQAKLAEKSGPAGDAERLRMENERLKVELATVKKELAELRKSLGINAPPKGKPVSVDDQVKAYIASHPDLKPDVIAGLHQSRPVPGMTLEEFRLFASVSPSDTVSESLSEQVLLLGVNQPGDPATNYFRCAVRRVDGMILEVTGVGHGKATTWHR